MTRRELLGTAAAAGNALSQPSIAGLPDFWKSRVDDVQQAVSKLKKATVQVVAKSAGGREIYLISYGEKQKLRSTANYNSACAGQDPSAYRAKDGRQSPVILLLGPVHGQELEGVVGLLNLLSVAETGRDLRGRDWPVLVEGFKSCRVLVVPVGNPDGRARCAVDSWMGADADVQERIAMGTTPQGQNYRWPAVKRFHPMRGAVVGELGAYFNDAGVNLMHDDWFAPMAAETRAFLRICIEEAPDFIVCLHSHGVEPSVEPTAYVPATIKRTIRDFSQRLYARYAEAGLPTRKQPTAAAEDGTVFPPPSFNLASALHHTCGAVAFVHETPGGLKQYVHVTHENMLDIQMLLYAELLAFAQQHPTRWTRQA
jgi:hypothetical protein